MPTGFNLRQAQHTGPPAEFVANIAAYELREEVNITSHFLSAGNALDQVQDFVLGRVGGVNIRDDVFVRESQPAYTICTFQPSELLGLVAPMDGSPSP